MYHLAALLQPLDRLRREAYGGDLDLASITEAIALAAIAPAMCNAGRWEDSGGLGKVAGIAAQQGVHALSVSQMTGIPRETTRRKIKKLIALGVLTKVRRGEYVLAPEFAERAANPELVRQVMAYALRSMNEGLEQGFYALSDS